RAGPNRCQLRTKLGFQQKPTFRNPEQLVAQFCYVFELISLQQEIGIECRSFEHAAVVAMGQFRARRPAPPAAVERSDASAKCLPAQIQSSEQRCGFGRRGSNLPVLVTQVEIELVAIPGILFERRRETGAKAALLRVPAHERRKIPGFAANIKVFGVDSLIGQPAEDREKALPLAGSGAISCLSLETDIKFLGLFRQQGDAVPGKD